MVNIDIDKLRKDLIDDSGCAMNNGFSIAIVELSQIENASDEELIEIARRRRINLNKYKV